MSNEINALCILGGPRKDGITNELLQTAYDTLKIKNINTELVYLYDLKINPCRGCMKCKDTKRCVQYDDDHRIILDKMDKSDIIVFGSPTFFGNVTSVTKMFIDRSLGFVCTKKSNPPKRAENKPGKIVLITSCQAPLFISYLLGLSRGCINAMKKFFGFMNVTIKTFSLTGTYNLNQKRIIKAKDKIKKLVLAL